MTGVLRRGSSRDRVASATQEASGGRRSGPPSAPPSSRERERGTSAARARRERELGTRSSEEGRDVPGQAPHLDPGLDFVAKRDVDVEVEHGRRLAERPVAARLRRPLQRRERPQPGGRVVPGASQRRGGGERDQDRRCAARHCWRDETDEVETDEVAEQELPAIVPPQVSRARRGASASTVAGRASTVAGRASTVVGRASTVVGRASTVARACARGGCSRPLESTRRESTPAPRQRTSRSAA